LLLSSTRAYLHPVRSLDLQRRLLERPPWAHPLTIVLRPIPSDKLSMDELAQRAEMQLNVIETAYSIKIQNKEEIVKLLSKRLQDKRQIFLVCTSISSWIAGSNNRGDAVVPINMVMQLIEAASHSS
jgi:hypothetical protein